MDEPTAKRTITKYSTKIATIKIPINLKKLRRFLKASVNVTSLDE